MHTTIMLKKKEVVDYLNSHPEVPAKELLENAIAAKSGTKLVRKNNGRKRKAAKFILTRVSQPDNIRWLREQRENGILQRVAAENAILDYIAQGGD